MDTFSAELQRIALSAGRESLRDIADFSRWWLSRRPPIDVGPEDNPLASLWEVYCFAVRNGQQDELNWAWNYDLTHCWRVRLAALPEAQQSLVALAAHHYVAGFAFDLVEPFALNFGYAAQAIKEELNGLALAE